MKFCWSSPGKSDNRKLTHYSKKGFVDLIREKEYLVS